MPTRTTAALVWRCSSGWLLLRRSPSAGFGRCFRLASFRATPRMQSPSLAPGLLHPSCSLAPCLRRLQPARRPCERRTRSPRFRSASVHSSTCASPELARNVFSAILSESLDSEFRIFQPNLDAIHGQLAPDQGCMCYDCTARLARIGQTCFDRVESNLHRLSSGTCFQVGRMRSHRGRLSPRQRPPNPSRSTSSDEPERRRTCVCQCSNCSQSTSPSG